MTLFQLRANIQQGEVSTPRTWFVVAGALLEAMSLIPADFAVSTVELNPRAVAGPARNTGCMGQPVIYEFSNDSLPTEEVSMS